MIRRLAYVSRPRTNLPATEIPRIIVAARANNARYGISGILVYTGTDFAQLIEGGPPAVATLWQRIGTDDRHVDMTLLLDEHDTTPWFPDWRVGYLSDRGLPDRFAEWRARGRTLPDAERITLRRLLAAADAY
ncbi:MAG: BLUF domain-containing protein [Betaproteobacteria bacterium]